MLYESLNSDWRLDCILEMMPLHVGISDRIVRMLMVFYIVSMERGVTITFCVVLVLAILISTYASRAML